MRNLKLFLLISIFAFAGSNTVFPQKKMKLETDRVNSFTGERERFTKHENILVKMNLVISIGIKCNTKDDINNYTLLLHVRGHGRMDVLTSNPFFLKLSNNEIIKLIPLEKKDTDDNGHGVTWVNPKYGISEEELNLIYKYGILGFRFESNDKNIEESIKEKGSKKLQDVIYSILGSVN